MNTVRLALIALFAAGPTSVGPPAPPPAGSTGPIAPAAKIRQLEQRVARLERLGAQDLAAPGMLAVRGVWRIDGGHIVSPDDPGVGAEDDSADRKGAKPGRYAVRVTDKATILVDTANGQTWMLMPHNGKLAWLPIE